MITHDYTRAVEYFRNAVQSSPHCIELRWELARLYIKLKHNQEAVDTLVQSLEIRDRRTNAVWDNSSIDNTHGSRGFHAMDSMDIAHMETHCLMAVAYIAVNEPLNARQCLLKAIILKDIAYEGSKLDERGEKGKKAQRRRRQTRPAEKTYRFYDGVCESDTEAGHRSVHSSR